MWLRLREAVLANPRGTLVVIMLLTLLAGVGFKNAWLNNSYKASFEADDPLLVAMNDQEATFAKNDNMVVLIKAKQGDIFARSALAAVDAVTEAGWQAPYSSRVDSITNYNHAEGVGDELVVAQPLDAPQTKTVAELARGRQIVMSTPELLGNMVAPDGSSALVLMTFQLPENPLGEMPEISRFVHAQVDQIAKQHPELQFYVTGTVENANAFVDAMVQDMMWLIPIGYTLMIGFLALLLRSAWAVAITLSIVTLTSIITMGLKCWLDGSINAVNMFAPTMIMTVAIADCVHFMTSFLQYYREGHSKADAMRMSLKSNFKAVLLTSVTTAIGFAGLNFHESPPYQSLGNIVSTGVMVAWLLSVIALPALVMVLPIKPGKPQHEARNIMLAWANFVIRHAGKVLVVMLLTCVTVLAVGLPRTELNEMFTKYLDDSFAFTQANQALTREMGGIHRLLYTVDSGEENGIYDPAYLQRLDGYATWLRQQPEISHVDSYTDVLKRLNRAMNGNDPVQYRLPESRELAAQYALVYEFSLPEGQSLTNVVSLDKRKTLLVAVAKETDSNTLLALNARAEAWLRSNTPAAMHAKGAGLDLMFSNMAMNNIPQMVYGTFVDIVVVSLIILISLRSWSLGLLSMAINALPIAMAIGVWGLLSGRIGIGVAAVGMLSFGIVVDDTVHFLHHYREYRREGMSVEDAIRKIFTSTGMAMLTITLMLAAGFGVLTFSHYSANHDMGTLTAICMGLAMFFDLALVPAGLVWWHRRKAAAIVAAHHGQPLPGPERGLTGHLPLLAQGEHGCFYDSLRQLRAEHGDLFQLNVLGKPWVVVSDLDAIYRILVTDRDKFPKAGDAVDEMKAIGGEFGILVTEGRQWLRQRQIAMPAFRHEQLQAMMVDMNAISRRAVEELRAQPELVAKEFLNRVALAIICQVGFDYRLASLTPDGKHDPLLEAQELASRALIKRLQRTKYWKQLPLPENFRLDQAMAAQRRIIEGIIAERKDGHEDAKLLLDQLVRAVDDDGQKLSDEEVYQQVYNFLAAGHETSGALLQWAMYYLSTHPEVQEQLRAELDQVLGERDEITFEDFKAMPVMNQFLQECLRVRPPIPIMLRAAGEDIELGGYHVPKDAVVLVMIGEVQRDPKYWGGNAEFFDIDHFAPGADANRPNHAYAPFGIGPRICIGHRFTMLEAAVMFGHLLRHYRFRWPAGQAVEPKLELVWTTRQPLRFNVEALATEA